MPQTPSSSLLSPTKFMVARGNHLCAPLCAPVCTPLHFMNDLSSPPQPITALHALYAHLTRALSQPYACLTHTL